MMTTRDEAVEEQENDSRVRVRVSNTADAETSQFRLSWKSKDSQLIAASEMPVQVPPGESRVVPMPAPRSDVMALSVLDDDHAFDNDTFVTSRDPLVQKLIYVGKDADPTLNIDPKDSLFYYLSRVPLSNRFRHVTVEALSGDWPESLDPKDVPLMTLAGGVATPQAALLKKYIQAGGRVLIVFSDVDETAESLAALREITGAAQLNASEAKVNDYVMLSQIAFSDPIFASMADPQFNDFTKIRFWQHRTLNGVPDQWKVLASYDDGDPALLEVPCDGDGKMWVLTTGWQPESSQLALSTKFIPMVFGWFKWFVSRRKSCGELHDRRCNRYGAVTHGEDH